jgi:hypothetical protein
VIFAFLLDTKMQVKENQDLKMALTETQAAQEQLQAANQELLGERAALENRHQETVKALEGEVENLTAQITDQASQIAELHQRAFNGSWLLQLDVSRIYHSGTIRDEGEMERTIIVQLNRDGQGNVTGRSVGPLSEEEGLAFVGGFCSSEITGTVQGDRMALVLESRNLHCCYGAQTQYDLQIISEARMEGSQTVLKQAQDCVMFEGEIVATRW